MLRRCALFTALLLAFSAAAAVATPPPAEAQAERAQACSPSRGADAAMQFWLGSSSAAGDLSAVVSSSVDMEACRIDGAYVCSVLHPTPPQEYLDCLCFADATCTCYSMFDSCWEVCTAVGPPTPGCIDNCNWKYERCIRAADDRCGDHH
jgi:hypothetical protein